MFDTLLLGTSTDRSKLGLLSPLTLVKGLQTYVPIGPSRLVATRAKEETQGSVY